MPPLVCRVWPPIVPAQRDIGVLHLIVEWPGLHGFDAKYCDPIRCIGNSLRGRSVDQPCGDEQIAYSRMAVRDVVVQNRPTFVVCSRAVLP